MSTSGSGDYAALSSGRGVGSGSRASWIASSTGCPCLISVSTFSLSLLMLLIPGNRWGRQAVLARDCIVWHQMMQDDMRWCPAVLSVTLSLDLKIRLS
jgi:hypothetical protein